MPSNVSQQNLQSVLSDRLKQWMRDNESLDTQAKLSVAAGVGQTTVSRILNKQVSPTIDVLELIAAAFEEEAGNLIARPNAEKINYDKKKYALLPSYEKVRIEGFIAHTIAQYNQKN